MGNATTLVMKHNHPTEATGRPYSGLPSQAVPAEHASGRHSNPARRRSRIPVPLLHAILEGSSSESSIISSDNESSKSSGSSSGRSHSPSEEENSSQQHDEGMQDSSTATSITHSTSSSLEHWWNNRDIVPYWDDEWQTSQGAHRPEEERQADRQEESRRAGNRSVPARLWHFMTCGDSDDDGTESEVGQHTPLTLTQRRLLLRRRQERAYRVQLLEENRSVSLRAMLYSFLAACVMMAIALGTAAYINGGLHVPPRRHRGDRHH